MFYEQGSEPDSINVSGNNGNVEEGKKSKKNGKKSDENSDDKNVKKKRFLGRFFKKHPVTASIICGLILAALVYGWKEIESNIERRADYRVASERMDSDNEIMLKMVCKPLVWNIRSEMLRGDMNQIDLFITDFVKTKNMQFIMLVESGGLVQLSTDKSKQGKSLEEKELVNLLKTDTITVMKEDNDEFVVAAPVMGYDSRLSTLIFGYKPESFTINEMKNTKKK